MTNETKAVIIVKWRDLHQSTAAIARDLEMKESTVDRVVHEWTNQQYLRKIGAA
jgi:IS30 family transposase